MEALCACCHLIHLHAIGTDVTHPLTNEETNTSGGQSWELRGAWGLLSHLLCWAHPVGPVAVSG